MSGAEASPNPRSALLTWLGILGVGFYAAHAVYELAAGRPESLLWTCNVASLAVGAGLLLGRPTCIGIGVMWLVLGLPLWMLELAAHGGFEPTASLTHVGGLVLGLAGIHRLGLPGSVWWKAAAALTVLYFVSRWTTPVEANINLAFSIWPGFEPYFPCYRVYLLAIAAWCMLVFAGTQCALRLTGFAPPPS